VPPVYSDSKRPYFTREMAIRNLEVKKNNVGVNGKICLFYNCRSSSISSPKNSPKKKETTTKHTDLIAGLNSLGIQDVSHSEVDAAVKKCFPDGANSIDEGEVLRAVFCQIKAQNSTDNVNG